ncbi:MAG: quinone oxidoreductase [Polyangiales bacterium]
MTKAIRILAPGGPEALVAMDVEVPAPAAGEVTLRQTAIGVNFIDTYHRSGLYPLPTLPHGIGVEAAGVVEAIGPGVTGLRIGERVAYAGGAPGSYAERRNVAAERLVPVPDAVPDDVAAAAMLQGMTAEYLVRRTFRVEAGMRVLVHAAAGGVGLLLCQWLSSLGATVLGTVGTEAKAGLAAENGCHHPIVYTRDDFVAKVRELTGGAGVHVVYDAVGRSTFTGSLACLARRGMLVSFGNASGAPDPFDVLELSRKGSLYLTRPTLFDYIATREELLESSGEVFGRIANGSLRLAITERRPLAEAADAHRALESRGTTGKTLLVP